MTTQLEARRDGHGHVLVIDGAAVKFDTVWDVYGEELCSVVVWTHGLPDAEVVERSRAYLEGSFAATYVDPYGELGIDPDTWEAATVRRVWARWRPLTDEERAEGYEGDDDVRWVEQGDPGEGLAPVCVVDLETV